MCTYVTYEHNVEGEEGWFATLHAFTWMLCVGVYFNEEVGLMSLLTLC